MLLAKRWVLLLEIGIEMGFSRTLDEVLQSLSVPLAKQLFFTACL
jgi:hypothetical protein